MKNIKAYKKFWIIPYEMFIKFSIFNQNITENEYFLKLIN